MTVRVAILNSGNHPDDRVVVKWISSVPGDARQHNERVLLHGDSMWMSEDVDYQFAAEKHGSGLVAKEHVPMAVVADGSGRRMVREDFNPSEHGRVTRIKRLAAALINEVEVAFAGEDRNAEVQRLQELAKTAAEEAAMWGVKALTAR